MKRNHSEVSAIRLIKGVLSALVAVLTIFLAAGCGAPGSGAIDGPSGSAAVVISALGANDVAGATVSVTATDIAVPVTASLSASDGWQATIDGIPAGSGRTFTLSATDASGIEQYHGATYNVTITPGQTESIVIVAQQTSQPSAFGDAVPVIDLAQASSNKVAPGGVLNLSVTAHDPDSSDLLTYAWTASTGAFSSSTAQSTTWTAPATLGTYPITIAVRDSKQEVTATTLQITVAPPAQVPIPQYITWLLAAILAAIGSLLSHRVVVVNHQSRTHPSPQYLFISFIMKPCIACGEKPRFRYMTAQVPLRTCRPRS
jgi:hypothetical protein